MPLDRASAVVIDLVRLLSAEPAGELATTPPTLWSRTSLTVRVVLESDLPTLCTGPLTGPGRTRPTDATVLPRAPPPALANVPTELVIPLTRPLGLLVGKPVGAGPGLVAAGGVGLKLGPGGVNAGGKSLSATAGSGRAVDLRASGIPPAAFWPPLRDEPLVGSRRLLSG
ncbi:MAG: hypothetical protein JO100_11395 [Pseudonocardia sp.]|nr:hypothetical protein [Pseudonocardia sp.]